MAKQLTMDDEIALLYGQHKADPENEAVKEEYEQVRDLILRFKAKRGTTLETLEADLAERLVSAKKKAEASVKAEANKAINAAKAVVIAKVEAAATLAEARALIPEVEAFGERYSLTLTATGFSTNLKRASTAGKGRPGKNDHSGFVVVASGEAIMGGFNTYVKALIEAKSLDEAIMAKIHGKQNGKLLAKAKTAPVFVEAGLVRPATEAELSAAAEDSSDETEAEASEETSS